MHEKFTHLVDLGHFVVQSPVHLFPNVCEAHFHGASQNCDEFHCVHLDQLVDGFPYVRLNFKKIHNFKLEKKIQQKFREKNVLQI